MKLKTLKDLEIDDWLFQKAMETGPDLKNAIPIRMNDSDPDGTYFPLIEPFVMSSELKKEAIKWYKYFDELEKNQTIDDDFTNHGRKEILINFFNLTEDDLK